METKIKPTDEYEAKVDFEGYIIILRENQAEFEKDLQMLIEQYAI